MPGFELGSFEDIDMKTNPTIYDSQVACSGEVKCIGTQLFYYGNIFSYEEFSY